VTGRQEILEPDFDRVPTCVRTFYWVPIIGWFARAWIERHDAYRPDDPRPVFFEEAASPTSAA
jgi:hypothetical protein